MADLQNLENFLQKYVELIDSSYSAAGWVVKVHPAKKEGTEKTFREVEFDYGYGYPVTSNTTIKEIEPPDNEKNGPADFSSK